MSHSLVALQWKSMVNADEGKESYLSVINISYRAKSIVGGGGYWYSRSKNLNKKYWRLVGDRARSNDNSGGDAGQPPRASCPGSRVYLEPQIWVKWTL